MSPAGHWVGNNQAPLHHGQYQPRPHAQQHPPPPQPQLPYHGLPLIHAQYGAGTHYQAPAHHVLPTSPVPTYQPTAVPLAAAAPYIGSSAPLAVAAHYTSPSNYNCGGTPGRRPSSSLYSSTFPKVKDEEREEKKATIIKQYQKMRIPVCDILDIQVPMTKFLNNSAGRGECREVFDSLSDLLRYHSFVHECREPGFQTRDQLMTYLRRQNRTETEFNVQIHIDRFTELVEEYPTYDLMIDNLHGSIEDDARDVGRVVDSYYKSFNHSSQRMG